MTVSELIADLSIYPSDFEIELSDSEYGDCPIQSTRLSAYDKEFRVVISNWKETRTAVEQDKYERDQSEKLQQQWARQGVGVGPKRTFPGLHIDVAKARKADEKSEVEG